VVFVRFKKFGKTDMSVSVVGYGAWELGGNWGPIEKENGVKILNLAYDNGVNFFDTAPAYGRGQSEEIVGEFLKGKKREDLYIATKCGLEWDQKGRIRNNLKKERVLKEIDDSLKRLKCDYVDLYQIHWPDPNTPLEETAEALQQILDSKKARYIGVSNFSAQQIETLIKYVDIVSTQNYYNLLVRDVEKELFPVVDKYDLTVIPYSPLAKGLLTGKISKDYEPPKKDPRAMDEIFKNRELFVKSVEKVEELKILANKIGRPLSQMAINWLSHHKQVSTVIAGSKDEKHVLENIEAGSWELSEDIYLKIEKIVGE
jgi:aryl-alcohol dehydrogenase-like predicted oxidoreductase